MKSHHKAYTQYTLAACSLPAELLFKFSAKQKFLQNRDSILNLLYYSAQKNTMHLIHTQQIVVEWKMTDPKSYSQLLSRLPDSGTQCMCLHTPSSSPGVLPILQDPSPLHQLSWLFHLPWLALSLDFTVLCLLPCYVRLVSLQRKYIAFPNSEFSTKSFYSSGWNP